MTLIDITLSNMNYSMIDDKYLVIYGGTNGLSLFDNVIRYEIEKQQWKVMSKYP